LTTGFLYRNITHMKNEAAVTLAKLRKGITERKTAKKTASSRANIAKANAVRLEKIAARKATTTR
jgi:hypothetical protein